MTTDRIAPPTRSRKYLYGGAALALLILGSVAAIATAPRALTWSVPSLSPAVVAGGAATTTTVSLTAEDTLPNAVVEVSPSLAGLVSVSPMDLATIPNGRAVTLTLTSSAPASSTPGVVQGYIRIVKENPNRQAYGTPLPVNLNVTWPTIASAGITVTYPSQWTLDQDLLSANGPISIRNFPAFTKGGFWAPGGAVIYATKVQLPSEPLDHFIQDSLAGATIESTSTQSVAGLTGENVTYHFDVGPNVSNKGRTIYVPSGSSLFKFTLLYIDGDPQEPSFLQTFTQFLSSVQLSD